MGLTVSTAAKMGVALLVVAIVMPIALLAIADANVTGWTSSTTTIFQTLLPVVAVIGVAIAFLPGRRK